MFLTETKKIFNVISCIDYISMLMILFYHSLYYVSLYTEIMTTNMLFTLTFLNIFGLTGFTFSSGFKLVFNHYENLKNKSFYKKYTIKRTINLYKGYLIFPILCLVIIYTFHFCFGLFGKSDLIRPFLNQISPINISSIIDFLFFALTPVAGQLWYVHILLLVNIISLIGFRVYGYRAMLFGVFPLLLIYFSINRHIVDSIAIKSEIPYYICLYMTIFLFGAMTSYLYHSNKKHFRNFLVSLSSLFLLIIIGFFYYEVNGNVFPSNYYFQLLYGNPFYKYGLTFPAFLLGLLLLMKSTKLITLLAANRKYTMLIFLMQYPFTIPFYNQVLLKFGIINQKSILMAWISPMLVTLFSIVTCMLFYNLYKKSFTVFMKWRDEKYIINKKQVNVSNNM